MRFVVLLIIVLNPFLNSCHCIISIYLIYTAKISINVQSTKIMKQIEFYEK